MEGYYEDLHMLWKLSEDQSSFLFLTTNVVSFHNSPHPNQSFLSSPPVSVSLVSLQAKM